LILVVVDAHHDGGLGAGQGVGRDAGMLERLPGHLEQHALLRVHRLGFPWGDAEEVGVEAGDVVEEATPFGRHPTGNGRVRVVVGVGVPPLGGDFADGVAPLGQQVPVTLRPVHVAGETAADSDHRHRLGE
jgi:hypothetical protein